MKHARRNIAVLLAFLGLASGVAWAEDASPRVEPDIVYGHKDGLAMTMDLIRPAGASNGKAILFMVSGGWVSRWQPPEQTMGLFDPYLKKGFSVFAVRHGSSPRYGIPDAVADVRRAVRYVRMHAERLGVDPERLGVMGMSAGGHLALMLGTSGDDGDPDAKDAVERVSSRVAAVAALVPPTDLRVAVWEAPESLPAYRNFPALDLELKKAGSYSPLTHVTPDDAPALVIMGGKDELVPPRHGEWIAEAYEREKVPHKLIIFPDGDHGLGGLANLGKALAEVNAWFAQHLLDASEPSPNERS